jgi:hypothetical protein
MATNHVSDDALKQALKSALSEALHEQRDLLYEVFAEVLEDYAVAEAIREGRKSKVTTRDEVLRIIRGTTR